MGLRFRVISFNIRHYWADDGEDSWEFRKDALVRVLRDNPAEIICFQEINYPIFGFLSQALEGYGIASDLGEHGPRWEYRPVFVRSPFKVRELETYSLSGTPAVPSKSWGSNFIRQVTRVLLECSGNLLAVYNTHLDFEEEVQANQARVILEIMGKQDRDRPIILAGDFNSTAEQKAHGLLTGKGQGGQGGFQDSMPEPRPDTFHGFKDEPGQGCIDWILYRGQGLDLATPARVIKDRPKGRYPSDHFPILSGFELKTP